MFVKARFEMWLKDESPEAGQSVYDDPEASSFCRVFDKVVAACEAEKGALATITLLKSTKSIAEIPDEHMRRNFLHQNASFSGTPVKYK
jgi:hypothetical protein